MFSEKDTGKFRHADKSRSLRVWTTCLWMFWKSGEFSVEESQGFFFIISADKSEVGYRVSLEGEKERVCGIYVTDRDTLTDIIIPFLQFCRLDALTPDSKEFRREHLQGAVLLEYFHDMYHGLVGGKKDIIRRSTDNYKGFCDECYNKVNSLI